MNSIWVHVDINSYFATLLQQEIPSLRGVPVAIVKEAGRTCIIAASKEAKKYGVKTGCRVKEAQLLCPQIKIMPAYFPAYLSATKRLMALFETLAPDVELFSLDEAFIFYSPIHKLYHSVRDFGYHIQKKIKEELGEWVTCNVGIARNRFLAKMTGEVSPKGSVTMTEPDEEPALLASTSFEDVCGVGHRLQNRLKELGVTVPYQLNFLTDDDLQRYFGPFWSAELRKVGRGDEPLFLTRIGSNPYMKSVGRSITGYTLCDDEDTIKSTLYNLTEECVYKVRKMGLAGRQIGIHLSGENRYFSDHITLKHYIRHTAEMFDIVYTKIYKSYNRDFKVIKFGVYLGLLLPWHECNQTLFESWWKQEAVSTAVDTLTTKYGLFTVKSGLLLNKHILRPEVAGFLGDAKFHFMK